MLGYIAKSLEEESLDQGGKEKRFLSSIKIFLEYCRYVGIKCFPFWGWQYTHVEDGSRTIFCVSMISLVDSSGVWTFNRRYRL